MDGVNSTGIKSVDETLGGGVITNRIVEFWGDEQSGKTGTAISLAKSFEHVFFFDLDGTFPWELKETIAGRDDGFNVISVATNKEWIGALSIPFPDDALLVFDPISVINPYIVSNYFSRVPRNVTVLLISHSNSQNKSPIEATAAMFCSQRMQFRYIDKIIHKEDRKNVLGFRTAVKTMKNTLIPPRVESIMEVYFGTGAT